MNKYCYLRLCKIFIRKTYMKGTTQKHLCILLNSRHAFHTKRTQARSSITNSSSITFALKPDSPKYRKDLLHSPLKMTLQEPIDFFLANHRAVQRPFLYDFADHSRFYGFVILFCASLCMKSCDLFAHRQSDPPLEQTLYRLQTDRV